MCSSSFQNPVSFFGGVGCLRGTSCATLMLSMVRSFTGIAKLLSTMSLLTSFLINVIIIHMKYVPTIFEKNA
jgi:hypothetical protein